jgi:hypothetical protein
MTKAIAVQCQAIPNELGDNASGRRFPAGRSAVRHGGAAGQVKAKAAIRAQVLNWGLGDSHVDPGEVLLRLVTQSAARAEHYSRLLQEAFESAERLKRVHDGGAQIEAGGDELADTAETVRRDLDRIFNTGGVAALVGNTYGAAKDVGIYVTGEAIRGLADLEAKERERCANFAAKAVAAGQPRGPYGSRSNKGSSWWRWCKRLCEKLIFHRSRRRRLMLRWLNRQES